MEKISGNLAQRAAGQMLRRKGLSFFARYVCLAATPIVLLFGLIGALEALISLNVISIAKGKYVDSAGVEHNRQGIAIWIVLFSMIVAFIEVFTRPYLPHAKPIWDDSRPVVALPHNVAQNYLIRGAVYIVLVFAGFFNDWCIFPTLILIVGAALYIVGSVLKHEKGEMIEVQSTPDSGGGGGNESEQAGKKKGLAMTDVLQDEV